MTNPSDEPSQQAGATMILIIRHAERPDDKAEGVTIDGVQDKDSLIPRGWQRAGALAGLFAPQQGSVRPGLARPDLLIAPKYAKHVEDRRTHETIQPLSEVLRSKTTEPYAEEHEAELGWFASEESASRVVLICWEHTRIPKIGEGIVAVSNRQDIPKKWPPQRFDLIWRFLREGGSRDYYFSLFPQLLLANDSQPPRAP
jgi:hypothetical protein